MDKDKSITIVLWIGVIVLSLTLIGIVATLYTQTQDLKTSIMDAQPDATVQVKPCENAGSATATISIEIIGEDEASEGSTDISVTVD